MDALWASFRNVFWKRHLCVWYRLNKDVQLYQFLTLFVPVQLSAPPLYSRLFFFGLVETLGFFHLLVYEFAKILGASLQRCYCSADWHSAWAGRAGQGKKHQARKEQKPFNLEFLFQVSLNQQLWPIPALEGMPVQSDSGVCGGDCFPVICQKPHFKKCLFFCWVTGAWLAQRSWEWLTEDFCSWPVAQCNPAQATSDQELFPCQHSLMDDVSCASAQFQQEEHHKSQHCPCPQVTLSTLQSERCCLGQGRAGQRLWGSSCLLPRILPCAQRGNSSLWSCQADAFPSTGMKHSENRLATE